MNPFSQHSLGDFADCQRRYYLRYVAQQAWPLVETSPVAGLSALDYQAYLRKGALFHRWIERHWLGLDPSPNGSDGDAELQTWWLRFVGTDFADLPQTRAPEVELVAPLGEHRLYARFDLLATGASDGQLRAVIVDWKTLRGENRPSAAFLKNRLQTRVYLFVLATAGAPFNGGVPFAPEQCAMRYWLANFPDDPWTEVGYSRAEYEADGARLRALVAEIARRATEADFDKTDDERKCAYCTYRTLCHRARVSGVQADELDEPVIELGEIAEMEY